MTELDPKEVGLSVLRTLLQENLSADPENYRHMYQKLYGADEKVMPKTALPDDWRKTLGNFLQEWDRSQTGLSHLQKIQQRNRLLTGQQNAAETFAMMAKLVGQWRALSTRASAGDEDNQKHFASLQQIWLRGLRSGFAIPLESDAKGQAIIEAIDRLVADATTSAEDLVELLRNLWNLLEEKEKEKEQIQDVYRRALHILFSSSTEWFAKTPWFGEQLKSLGKAFEAAPESALRAQELLSGLSELLYRQEQRRVLVNDVDRTLEELLQLVFQYIESLSEGSSETYEEFVRLSSEIAQSEDPAQIRQLVGRLVERSRSLQDMLRESLTSLREARVQLENARSRVQDMEEEISQLNLLVHEDPLTRLLNRRGLHLAFERETARLERQHGVLSIALLDLDHFKKINDHYGHEIGDEVLRHFSQMLRQSLRTEDAIARYGGEEFVILMPGAASDTAIQILRRLQKVLQVRPLRTKREQPITVSFSAGVVGWSPATNLETALADADQALYQAKRDGRQRIYLSKDHSVFGSVGADGTRST
ncbi:diguanylate cyclase [Acidithiobacillus sp. AMEEHan]|uniref:GGDEF domain-containing protein n=1 Tax=Acidithiobacillus sp. AMEEHan TaxID=2994951 RepID=UPI0027E4EA3F|nr:diguanylate cyclase [Acidithiobacillus sp. AMEEHan]